MYKFGDIRAADGFMFKGYRVAASGRTLEHWISPGAWARKQAKQKLWHAGRYGRMVVADDARIPVMREYSRVYMLAFRRANPSKAMVNAARHRAKVNGLPFNITASDVPVPEFCPVLGVPLSVADGACSDNSPSIDRIIPALGYVKGNCIVVSRRANRIKNDATVAELVLVAEFYKNVK